MEDGQLGAVVAAIHASLADAVMGIYLHGSSVSGGLRPTSDLDLVVVTSRRTTAAERRHLIDRLLPISGPGDPAGRARSVDIEVVAQQDVRPWRYPPRLDVQFGDWYRSEFARGDYAPWDPENPDLAIILEMVLQAGRPLFGPPPSELYGPIPWADVRQAMLDTIPDLLAYLDGDERNVVLTFARILATLATGRFLAKDEAAGLVAERAPEGCAPVLERAAWLYREGIAAEDWAELWPRVRPCVDWMVEEIGRTA